MTVQQKTVPPVPVPAAPPRYTVMGAIRTAPGVQQIRVAATGCVQPVASLELHNVGAGKISISNVFVHPEHRRHGVAKQMMNGAIAAARRDGFSVAQLEARPGANSIPAHTLVSMYNGLGFRTVGWSPRGGPIMERVLQHTPRPAAPRFAAVPNRVPVQPRLRVPTAGKTGVVQRADKFKFGFKESYATDVSQWTESGESTFSSVIWEPEEGASLVPLGMSKSTKSVTHGVEHAEDVALRIITHNLEMFSRTSRNKLILNISKSPCTSTVRMNGGTPLPVTSSKVVGCTEELINLVTTGITIGMTTYTFKLRIICRGLYCPSIPGSSQSDVLTASQAAVNALKATGQITVEGDARPAPSSNRYEVK